MVGFLFLSIMAGIQKSDLIGDSAEKGLQDFNRDIQKTTNNLNLLELSLKAVKETGKQLKGGLAATKPKDVKTLQEFNELTKRSNEGAKARLQIDKDLITEKIRLQELNKKRNKAIKEEIALGGRQLGTLERLKKKNKELAAAVDRVDLSTRKGRKTAARMNRTIDRNTKVIERNSNAMARQRMGIGRYQKAISGLRGGLAQLGVAFGAFALIRDSFNIIKDFQQAQADLASVLGVNTDAMADLTDQAKELGATTKFTASQVSELQTELAKLGFTQTQIQAMTESTLQLAAASGVELAQAATVAGATLNGFGLEATDTQRVVDVMAKSFSSSSLDMAKFSVAMASVAPVANQFGFSMEKTTALIGTLTDRGIDASAAGTGLRNMFLDSNKAGLTFEKALEKINKSSDKTGTSFDLFGKRGATLGVILAENGESVENLTVKLNDADGAAQAMADTQLNTLGGSLDLLRSAWEGFILSMDEAGGVGEKLRNGIVFLAENLDKILDVIGFLIKSFVGLKVAMFALKINKIIKDVGGLSKAFKQLTKGADGANPSIKAFGKALKGVGLGLAIGLLIEMAQAFWKIVSGANAAAEARAKFDKSTEAAARAAQERIEGRNKTLQEEIKTREQLRDLRLAEAESDKERLAINKDFLRVKQEILNSTGKQVKADIGAVAERRKGTLSELDLLRKSLAEIKTKQIGGGITDLAFLDPTQIAQLKEYNLLVDNSSSLVDDYLNVISFGQSGLVSGFATDLDFVGGVQSKVSSLNATLGATGTKLKLYREELEGVAGSSSDAAHQQELLGKQTNDTGKEAKKASTEWKNQIDVLDELTEAYREVIDVQKQLADVRRDEQIASIEDQIAAELALQEVLVGQVGEGAIDQTNLNALLEEKKSLQFDAIEATQEQEKNAAKDAFNDRIKELKEGAAAQRAELLAQETITNSQRAVVEAKFQVELDKIRILEIQGQETLDAQLLLADETANSEKLNVEREFQEEKKDIAEQTQEEIDAFNANELAKLKEQEQEKFEIQKQAIELTTDFFIKNADKRIAKIDEEINAAKKQADFLRDLAASGNISAKESLTEQNRLIAEAEVERERIEKQKQRILLVSSILQAFNANLAAGDDSAQAFTKAVTSTTVLTQFISALPTFLEGTEDTGKQGQGVDGKGGFHAILHPNERVMTKEENAKLGGLSNMEVANRIEQHRIGNELGGGLQIGGPWESQVIVDQLSGLQDGLTKVEKAIVNQETNHNELGEMFQAHFYINNTSKKGPMTKNRRLRIDRK